MAARKNAVDSGEAPRPPRADCKSAKTWQKFYAAKAAWFRNVGDSINKTFPDCDSVKYALNEAERFQAAADEIEKGRDPMQLDGTWK